MSLIFSLESSSFLTAILASAPILYGSCNGSASLNPAWAGDRLWHRQQQLRQSCGSAVALLSLVKDSWSSLGQAAGTPWGRGAGTSQKTWVNAGLMHFPVSIPSKHPFPGNYCILSKLKHKIIHFPSEVPRGAVKK